MQQEMQEFWDERAREDAFYFVENSGRYGEPDLARFWASGEEVIETMLRVLGGRIDPADRIVEIGCGLGRVTRALAARCLDVRALDISSEMLNRAADLNPGLANVEWILGDGHSLAGIEDSSADVCHSHVVFQHIPDPEITLEYVREIGRVLRPGGWAFFQISNLPEIHRRRRSFGALVLSLRARFGNAPKGQADPAWLGSAIELSDLRRVSDQAGMEIESVVGEGTQFCVVKARRRG